MKNMMHIELLKFTFFFSSLLIFWIGTLSNRVQLPCYIRQTFHVLMMILVTL